MIEIDLYANETLGVSADFEHEDIADGLEFEGVESKWDGFCGYVISRPNSSEKELIDFCESLYENVMLDEEKVECYWSLNMLGEQADNEDSYDALGDSIARLDREIWGQLENEGWED